MAVTISGTTGINLVNDGIITTSKFAAGAVDLNAMGSNSVNSSKIVDGSVLNSDLSSPYTGPTILSSVNTTSGTSVTLSTTLPAGIKRLTICFKGISTSGTSNMIVRLGSTTFTTTGYVSSAGYSNVVATDTTGLLVRHDTTAVEQYIGQMMITNISGNTWLSSGLTIGNTNQSHSGSGGYVTLGGVLNSVQITTVAGTDTFDSGTVTVVYE